MVKLTPEACEEVRRILQKQEKPDQGLRAAVKGGGCSGLSYALSTDTQKEGDHVIEYDGMKVFVDPKSLLYLKDTIIDFQDGLEGRGFKFRNPNADKSCGCGESFSV